MAWFIGNATLDAGGTRIRSHQRLERSRGFSVIKSHLIIAEIIKIKSDLQ